MITNVQTWAELSDTMGSPDKKWIRNEFGELYWDVRRSSLRLCRAVLPVYLQRFFRGSLP